jgi:hypothetical protein
MRTDPTMTRRSMMATAACAAWLLLPIRTPCLGAGPDDGSPETVVRGAVGAMNQGRLGEFVKAMHPEALKKFRVAILRLADLAAKDGKSAEVLRLFPDTKDLADLKKLDDGPLLERYLRGALGASPEVKKMLAGAKTEMIGHLDEGEDRTHVVYRVRLDPGVPNAGILSVASLRRDGRRWAMLLSGDVEGMVAMMEKRVAGQFAFPDIKASKVEPLGRLLDKDVAQVVYRMATPLGDSTLTKTAVIVVPKADPAFDAARDGKPADLAKLIKEKLGL